MGKHTWGKAKSQAAKLREATAATELPGTGAIGFWKLAPSEKPAFQVNPGCCPGDAQRTAEVFIGYVRDRIDQAVVGDIPGDGTDTSINGDEAFVLGFVMHAALALVQALPVAALPEPSTEGDHDA